MNKIDLCYTGGFKSQKWEQTIVRRTKFFQQFSPKYLVIQCTQGFSKKLKDFPKKTQGTGGFPLFDPPKKRDKKKPVLKWRHLQKQDGALFYHLDQACVLHIF